MDSSYKNICHTEGYTQRIYKNGDKYWYLNDKLHREDGPAAEYPDGTKYWYLNDKLHREDGPAIEWSDGYKAWYLNGERHREDGPAIEFSDGTKEWWLNNIQVTEEVFYFIMKRKRRLSLKYWLKWTDYIMNPNTERGKGYANRQFDKLVKCK